MLLRQNKFESSVLKYVNISIVGLLIKPFYYKVVASLLRLHTRKGLFSDLELNVLKSRCSHIIKGGPATEDMIAEALDGVDMYENFRYLMYER